MTVMYHILRIIEIIVIMLTGIRLLTCPYEMRWDGKKGKILFDILWGIGTLIPIINGFWFKFSGVEYIIVAGYTLMVALIFYKIPVFCAAANNLVLWVTLYNIHCMTTVISGNQTGIKNINEYNMDFSRIHPLELGKSILVIGVLMVFYRRNKPIFFRKNLKLYLGIIVLTMIEWWSVYVVFSPIYYARVEPKNTQIAVLILILVSFMSIFYILYDSYMENKQKVEVLYLKDSMLEEQFAFLQENYEQKRKQVHDSVQQNLLLCGYLEQGKIQEALQYLQELQSGLKRTQIKSETGITAIDVMLHYKRQKAEQQNTEIDTKIELYFSPLKQNDMCILLGNLLDNALEAVEKLPEEQRKIKLELHTVNRIFLLSIENPYQGKRRIRDGIYVTTKGDERNHGLGLESSQRIIEAYGGSFQIKDDGSTFRIEAIILNTEGKEGKENDEKSGAKETRCNRKSATGIKGN